MAGRRISFPNVISLSAPSVLLDTPPQAIISRSPKMCLQLPTRSKAWSKFSFLCVPSLPPGTRKFHLFPFTQQLASASFIGTIKNQLGTHYLSLHVSGKSAVWSLAGILLHGVPCGMYPVTAAVEVSSPRSVATVAQNATAHPHGAEWNLLSYLAGFGSVTVVHPTRPFPWVLFVLRLGLST